MPEISYPLQCLKGTISYLPPTPEIKNDTISVINIAVVFINNTHVYNVLFLSIILNINNKICTLWSTSYTTLNKLEFLN